MLAFFITWLVGYIFIFFSFISVLVEENQLNWNNVFITLVISVFSWLIVIAYIIIYLYEKLFKKSNS
jgi:hypothetical protein